MTNLTIGQKVEIDLEAIKGTEYESQMLGFNKSIVIITDVIEFHKTFTFKPTAKSRVEAILPMHFIKVA